MGNFSFAHLIGRGSARRLDDDTPEKPEDEQDEPQGRARSRRVEEPENKDDDPNAEEHDDRDDPDGQGRKGKKGNANARARGRRSEDDTDDPDAEDDPDEQPDENKDMRRGRKAERQRGAMIFASPHAAANPAMAAELAFNTNMSVASAKRVLKNAANYQPDHGKSARRNLDERMREANVPRLNTDTQRGALGALIDDYKKLSVRGK